MSEYVRRALQELQGNHFKLWACVIEYRQALSLQQFAEHSALDLATVKRLLPEVVASGFLGVDKSRRPHQYHQTQQLSLRFEEGEVKVANYDFGAASKVANCDSRVAKYDSVPPPPLNFADGLYLESAPKVAKCDSQPNGYILPLDTESLKDTVSARRFEKWNEEQIQRWREETLDYARESARVVGDTKESMGLHIRLWSHARRVDRIYSAHLVEGMFGILRELEIRRKKNEKCQGAAFNALVKRLMAQAGFPYGKHLKDECDNDPEILAFRQQFAQRSPTGPVPAQSGSDPGDGRKRSAAG